MNYIKTISINFIVLFCMLSVLEIGARIFFPEFKDHIFSSERSMNVRYHDGNFYNYQIRKPNNKKFVPSDKPLVLIFGDSISGGFGTAFEDIWWHRLQRLLLAKGIEVNVISISGYGNNMGDSTSNIIKAIKDLSSKRDIEIERIIYQFNFNDIMPFTSADLESSSKVNSILFSKLAKWRYEYANKSVFLRTAQHFAGKIIRKTSGTCEEREWSAMGPYTWTFGSTQYAKEAEEYWSLFKENLKNIKQITRELDIEFEIFLSPILYDVDLLEKHLHYNYLNYDFSCSTIDPRARFSNFEKNLDIKIYDPAPELKRSFESRLEEGNFTPYFFTADDNHFTPIAASYIAEVIAENW